MEDVLQISFSSLASQDAIGKGQEGGKRGTGLRGGKVFEKEMWGGISQGDIKRPVA